MQGTKEGAPISLGNKTKQTTLMQGFEAVLNTPKALCGVCSRALKADPALGKQHRWKEAGHAGSQEIGRDRKFQ
jgi:hypothetical protein